MCKSLNLGQLIEVKKTQASIDFLEIRYLVYIGECFHACNGHGWCQFESCQCDTGYTGRYCEINNEILFNQASFLLINQTDSLTYQG